MRNALTFAFAMSLIGGAPVSAAEQTVSIPTDQGNMFGTLRTEGDNPSGVVLLLHGFTGARDELATEHVPEGVFAYTAEQLAKKGYASLRIDFRGSGDSVDDLSFAETTFDGQAADAVAAVEYLRSMENVADDIYVIGWSQGGLVAADLAAQVDGLAGVALWNPVVDANQTFRGILGEETMTAGQNAAADEAVTTTLPWGAEVTLNGAFFANFQTADPAADIAKFKGPLFVATGSNDTTVLPETATALIDAHDGVEQHWIEEMDHTFNIFAAPDTLGTLVETTIAFFDAQSR